MVIGCVKRFNAVVMGIFCLALMLSACAASGGHSAHRAELGVPAYPGWVEKRKDDRGDPKTGVHFYKYEYFSDDPVDRIVTFYEKKTGREAAKNQMTGIFTITGRDGLMINVMGSDEGVPQVDQASQKVVKKWRSLITIMKSEQEH